VDGERVERSHPKELIYSQPRLTICAAHPFAGPGLNWLSPAVLLFGGSVGKRVMAVVSRKSS